MTHNGTSPYNPSANFTVYRNVISPYNAKGDGYSDDTAAIQRALTDGDGCAKSSCSGSTLFPKLVYFPPGNYIVSKTLQISMYTQIVGNPSNTPTIIPTSTFGANYVLDGFPTTDGSSWNGGAASLNFYKSIRNLNVDTTRVPAGVAITCVNWGVAQATSLRDMFFTMTESSQHMGIDMKGGGSGTFMGDLSFVGGNVGLNVNNEQFHFRNLNFELCTTAITTQHLYVGVFQNINFKDCGTGIVGQPTNGSEGVYSLSLIDSTASGVGTVIVAPMQSTSDIRAVVIDNLSTENVINIITTNTSDSSASVILAGTKSGSKSVSSYVRGVIYTNQSTPVFTDGQAFNALQKPSSMLTQGRWYGQSKPVFSSLDVSDVVNVKGFGALGDGATDDLAIIQAVVNQTAGTGKMVYFPYGVYRISATLYIPPGTILQGEAWSSIRADSGNSSYWSNEMNPQPVLQIGKPGDTGTFVMSDMVVEPGNVYPGAKLVEINMAGAPGDIGIWDCIFRTGGTASAVDQGQLCTTNGHECKSAWGFLHITTSGSAYLENVWGWNADHGIDNTPGANAAALQTGRGALIESTSPTYFVGVAMEHCSLYSVQTYNAQNVWLGLIQDETPYWQRDNPAPSNWTVNSVYHDPDFSNCAIGDVNCRQAFGLNFDGGQNIFSYGSAVWTFAPTQTNDIWITNNTPTNLAIFNPNNGGTGGGWTNIIAAAAAGIANVTVAANPGSWGGGVVAAYLPFAS
ncbi:glycoside hydrolase family 55 protein [Athelia psychrophila]|uniref:Glycoside hydrolase family 55 protein n=1 Tax=Athelia psychrophila TaxID=1759441 RepID=A0A166A575_9AGAM|nr:glycoside hydrolase family 55 protein [Fibularhizoctonia sp. CBS 109695]